MSILLIKEFMSKLTNCHLQSTIRAKETFLFQPSISLQTQHANAYYDNKTTTYCCLCFFMEIAKNIFMYVRPNGYTFLSNKLYHGFCP